MCQIEFWETTPDLVKVMLGSYKFHSGLHFDDPVLSTKRDQEMG